MSVGGHEIPNIPGLDTQVAIVRIGGNTEVYKKILKKFMDAQESVIREIKTALEKNDFDQAKLLAHSLKGVAGNIGATELDQQAEQLESLIKQEKPTDQALEKVDNELVQILMSIKQVKLFKEQVESEPETDSADIDIDAVNSMILELESFLQDDDPDALDIMDKIYPLLKNTPLSSKLDLLYKTVGNYDFKTALQHFAEFKEQFHKEYPIDE